MSRAIWLTLLLIFAFAAVVVGRLPARWISAELPADVVCLGASGTLWHGACEGLSLRGQSLGHLSWELQPLSLLGGKLAAQASLQSPSLQLRSDLTLRRGSALSLSDLKLVTQLPTPLIARLPRDLSGTLTADLAQLEITDGWVRVIRGRVEAQQIVSGGPEPAPLGNFLLQFDAPPNAGKIVGQLKDLGGPLQVVGTLTLNPTPGYLLEGRVAARPEANEVLQKQLQILGPADAAGMRRFAQEAEL